jgi:hypothetical protein
LSLVLTASFVVDLDFASSTNIDQSPPWTTHLRRKNTKSDEQRP